MAKYLIAFPSAAMVVPDGEWAAEVRDSHAASDPPSSSATVACNSINT